MKVRPWRPPGAEVVTVADAAGPRSSAGAVVGVVVLLALVVGAWWALR